MKKCVEVGATERSGAGHSAATKLRPSDHAQRHVARRRDAAVGGYRGVVEFVVGNAVRRVLMARVNRAIPFAFRLTDRGGSALRIVRTRLAGGHDGGTGTPLPRPPADHLDDAGHRVAAKQRRLRAADDFDAFHEISREVAEVERAAGLVQWDAVEQNLVVAALTAAD